MKDTYELKLNASAQLSLPLGLVQTLRTRLGKPADSWLRYRLPQIIGLCQSRWGLEVEEAIPGGATAVVLAVRKAGMSAVLKVHPERELAERELHGWQLWAGKGMPSLLEHDVELNVSLQERVIPARSLAEVGDRDIAALAATGLLARLHSVGRPLNLPTLSTLIARRFTGAQALVKEGQAVVTSDLLSRAREVADRLLLESGPDVALHGDFFPDNILFSQQRGWLAIDPQACRGDAAFDAGTWSYAYGRGGQLRSNAELFAQHLGVSSERISGWALVVAVTNLAGRAAYGHADQAEVATTLAACQELL
ncbi:MAG: aminoglycoside phosphotransferase family protein [Mycobacteriales bacterium]